MRDPKQERCPCGEPPYAKLWEGNVYLCRRHAAEWIHSEEKKRCSRGEKSGEPGGGPGDPAVAAGDLEIAAAVGDFVARIAPQGIWARAKRAILRVLRAIYGW